MNAEDIRTTYAYNRWANCRLLSAVAELPSEDFVRPLGGSFGSVQGTRSDAQLMAFARPC